MKTIRYDRYIFFDKKTIGSVRKLTRQFGVRYNSFAGEVIQRIYHFYFGDAINLNKEYKRFYKNEFEDVDKYVACRLGIPKEVRKRLIGNRIFYVNLDEKGEDLDNSFDYDDELKNTFWDLLGGLENEDSSRIRYEQFFD